MKIIKTLGSIVSLLLVCSFCLASADPTDNSAGISQFESESDASEARAIESVPKNDQPHFQSLFFDPRLNHVQMPKQSVDYELRGTNAIRIGPIELKGDDVAVTLSQEEAEVGELNFGIQYAVRRRNVYLLSFRWPTDYLTTGRMELIDDKSKVLWARPIVEKDLVEWNGFLTEENLTVNPGISISEDPKNSPKEIIKKSSQISRVHRGSQFGLVGRELLSIPIWNIKHSFRFCMTQDSPDGRLAACSRRYRFVRHLGKHWLETVSQQVRPRVLVNDKLVSTKGTAIFLDNSSPIKFATLLSSGTYFEFISSPKQINVLDLVKTDDGKFIEAIGYGHVPEGDSEIIDRSKEDFWSFLNFMPSIGEQREYWRVTFPYENPYIYFKGHGGIPFRQAFLFEDLPAEKLRPKISKNTKTSSYKDRPTIRGKVDSAVDAVKSEQISAKKTTETDFEWIYSAAKKGELNRSLLMVEDEGEVWNAYHEIYRGYPREIGLRLTGVVSNELELVFLGEIAAQWWFESLLGWENKLLSYQRWGVAAKYFQSFASMGKKEEEADLIKLQVSTVDLKYRLTPGVWNHDPSLGLILNYQSLVFEQFEANMAGAGIFWARSMPGFLDRIFNIVPIFDYPKWVDAELLWYPISLTPETELGPNFSINFHGKVQWGKQFYGEAGFGLKNYTISYIGESRRKKVALGVAYGTIGLGYNF